jgi:hypothetical protein
VFSHTHPIPPLPFRTLQGRVKRYKRIKAIDPFSKTHGVVDETKGKTYDLAPRASEVDAVPSSLRYLLNPPQKKHKQKEGGGGSGNHTAAGGDSSSKQQAGRRLTHIQELPGESLKSYARRVKNEMRKIRKQDLAASASAAAGGGGGGGGGAAFGQLHKISDKRKEFLERKKLKKNGKAAVGAGGADDDDDDDEADGAAAKGKKGNDSDDAGGPEFGHFIGDYFPRLQHGGGAGKKRRRGGGGEDDDDDDDDDTAGGGAGGGGGRGSGRSVDVVRFGERVEAPPTFSAVPRLSKKQLAAAGGSMPSSRPWKTKPVQVGPGHGGVGAGGGGGGGGNNHNNKPAAGAVGAGSSAAAARAGAGGGARSDALHDAQVERARQQAVQAYAALKQKRREAMGASAAAASAGMSSLGMRPSGGMAGGAIRAVPVSSLGSLGAKV